MPVRAAWWQFVFVFAMLVVNGFGSESVQQMMNTAINLTARYRHAAADLHHGGLLRVPLET